ncbi:hypothetical protein RhiirB3_393651 [Rhizophagus irregularis]|nr:hypothetical protein RhiirB3_393651 [Rhizophagus irregularis]
MGPRNKILNFNQAFKGATNAYKSAVAIAIKSITVTTIYNIFELRSNKTGKPELEKKQKFQTSFFGERYVLAFYPWVTDSIMNCFINVSIFFIDPGILNFEPGSWVSESKFLCKFTFGERVLDTDHMAYRSGLTISLVLFQKMKSKKFLSTS